MVSTVATSAELIIITISAKNDLGYIVSFTDGDAIGTGVLPKGRCPGESIEAAQAWHAQDVDRTGHQLKARAVKGLRAVLDGEQVPVFRAFENRRVRENSPKRQSWSDLYKRAMEIYLSDEIVGGVVTKINGDYSFCEVSLDDGNIRAILHCSSFGKELSRQEQREALREFLSNGQGIEVEMLEPKENPFRCEVVPVLVEEYDSNPKT